MKMSADQKLIIDLFISLLKDKTEAERYSTLLQTLSEWQYLFAGRRVLDFGASHGTSAVALIQLGASEVSGVEPSESRIVLGQKLVAQAGLTKSISLVHTPDPTKLPFRDGEFSFILVNAVLEHIPQPRDPYIKEIWRVLAPGSHLLINETPNKYFPKELHTTNGLWFNHWLPSTLAQKRAIRCGRFAKNRNDWASSGWRGVSYFEIVKSLGDYRLVPEQTRRRHRLLWSIGIPPSIIDPYPTWIFQKRS
jgi:ubiquinone/menaquinone biosynthesis C-methylase UbiE